MIGALIARDVRRGFTGAAWLPVAFFLLDRQGPQEQRLRLVGLSPRK